MLSQSYQETNSSRKSLGQRSDSLSVPSKTVSSMTVQTKLEMTDPDDAYEQEADRMADRITDHAFAAGAPTPQVSRSVISRTPSGYASVSVPASLESAISSSRGSGFSMPPALKARMESGFGADFSHVRIHTDSSAASMSSSIRANAFTSGNDIYFASGKYDPSSRSGQHLIAHELTHTLQQSGKVARESSDDSTIVNLPIPERISDRLRREAREAKSKENKCELYIHYILTHDPDIVKKKMTIEDVKKVSYNFTDSINHQRWPQSKAWTLEHILDEKGVESVDTDWLTDFLADEYDVFQADYEGALERALQKLAERRLAQTYLNYYSPKGASQKISDVKVFSYGLRVEIYRRLLDEAEKERFAPVPYKQYLAKQYAAFREQPLEARMSINEANAIRQKRKEDEEIRRENERQLKQERENDEYVRFFEYLTKRFFPTLSERYYDIVLKKYVTHEDLKEAFGFDRRSGFDVEDRDTKKILKLYDIIMSDLARKAGADPNNSSSMSSACQQVFNDAALMDSEEFKWDKRFVAYEEQLLKYVRDKTENWAEYFELPDNFISAETCTKIFFGIVTVALSFVPVGAFLGMGECVAKAAHFFTSKVLPKLVDIAVNESYDKEGTNQADMDFLTQALSLGIETFFSKLPVKSESVLGQLIKDSAKEGLQTMATDSSGYLVKYIYGDEIGDWAMVTTQNAMKSFAMSLGKGFLREGQKSLVFGGEAQQARSIANNAENQFGAGKMTLDQYDAAMERSNQITDHINMRNDFAFQVEEVIAGVADNTLNISEKIDNMISSKKPEAPVMVVPVYELLTIEDL